MRHARILPALSISLLFATIVPAHGAAIQRVAGTLKVQEPSVSDQGDVAGYLTNGSAPNTSVRWSQTTGVQQLGTDNVSAYGISNDGRVVVGVHGDQSATAAWWTDTTGWVKIPDQGTFHPWDANRANHDGSVIVGFGRAGTSVNFEGFRWSAATGIQRMGFLPGQHYSSAQSISADGAIVVGSADSANGREAISWTAEHGLVELGDLPGGRFESYAYDVSDDGRTIVGYSNTAVADEAFVWTPERGMRSLGGGRSVATAVSADGSVIVGQTIGPGGGACLWTEATGLRKIDQLLIAAGLTVPSEGLSGATSISSDGRYITCYTVLGAYLVTLERNELPEPSGCMAILFAYSLVAARPRRLQSH